METTIIGLHRVWGFGVVVIYGLYGFRSRCFRGRGGVEGYGV